MSCFLAASLAAVVSIGCQQPATPTAPAEPSVSAGASNVHGGSAALHRAVAEVRRATARFHNLEHAKDAGWDTLLTPCLTDPGGTGGMGFHYGNLSLFDAALDPLRPEALLYEPRGHALHLVAVEYIVPLGLSATPPTLFGHTFHRNEGAGIWALHLWLWKPNPLGQFENWNPRASCP